MNNNDFYSYEYLTFITGVMIAVTKYYMIKNVIIDLQQKFIVYFYDILLHVTN